MTIVPVQLFIYDKTNIHILLTYMIYAIYMPATVLICIKFYNNVSGPEPLIIRNIQIRATYKDFRTEPFI